MATQPRAKSEREGKAPDSQPQSLTPMCTKWRGLTDSSSLGEGENSSPVSIIWQSLCRAVSTVSAMGRALAGQPVA
jgi:hypothetical protein